MALHIKLKNLEERPNWALVRPNYLRLEVSRAFLDYVENVLTSDPGRAIRLSRTAIRHANRVQHKCLRVRAICSYAGSLRALGHLSRSKRCFLFAFDLAGSCSDCLPDLHRKYAYLLAEQTQHFEAEKRASLSLKLYQERNDLEGVGKAYLCRGFVHDLAGRTDASIEDLRKACEIIHPVSSFYKIAFQSYVVALSHSDNLILVERAAALLPGVRSRFVGLRDESLERTKLDFAEGGIAAKLAKVKPDLSHLERYGLRCKARQFLADALDQFLAQGMPLEATAVASDLAVVEAALDAARGRVVVRQLMANTLEKMPKAADAPLAAMRHVVAACRKADGTGPMWAALRELRDATVHAGCAPSLVPYPDPATAL